VRDEAREIALRETTFWIARPLNDGGFINIST
jgi:hypothetical protein